MPVFRQDRLYSALLTSGLQVKDPPLYQVIYQLIGALNLITNGLNTVTSGGGGGGGSSTINNFNTIQQLLLSDSDSGGSSDGLVIPGPAGADGINGMVPYFIASGEIFTIPVFKQALFSMNIDNQGILVIDGFLIEVD